MLVPVLLLAAAVSPPSAAASSAALDRLFAAVDRPDSPGCVVDVRRAGVPLALRRYGLADLETRSPIAFDTVFEAGSVSKQVVGALLAQLAERGALSLDDSVRRWLPELPPLYQPIRVSMLLHHTSGIREWSDLVALSGWPRGTRAYTMDDVLALLAAQRELNFAPGSEYLYSNSNYLLAARVAERAGGDSLQALSQRLLFAPLGMRRTRWRSDYRSVVPGRAQAYAHDDAGQWRLDMPFEQVIGPGGLLTTVGDLQRWNAALDVGGGWRARMAEPGALVDGTPVAYGLGLELEPVNGVAALSHAGATAAYHAWLGRLPSLHLSIAMLCNAGSIDTEALGPQLAALFMPPAAAPPAATAPLVALADDLPGRYRNLANDGIVELRREGGLLRLGERRYAPMAPDRLRADDGRLLQVERDRAGAIVALQVERPGNRPARLQPAPSWQPDAAALAAAAGRYRSAELALDIGLRVEGGHLLWVDPRGQRTQLQPTGLNTFRGEGWNLRLLRDAQGHAQGLRMSSGRVRQLALQRLPD
ncbi:serine hydrolase domain-containing protein [Xanthomonas sacchari]|uniref:serine hydrolase domain-containing protein n=1 Tax=Xanthomonas sacchari TaxID=56458 RepID=UPI003B219F53